MRPATTAGGAAAAAPRIAYITTAFPWRSETAVIKEIFELDRLGFDVRVVSLKRTGFHGIFDPKAHRFQDRTWYPGPGALLLCLALSLHHLIARPRYRKVLGETLRRSGRHLHKTLYILFLVPWIARRLRAEGVQYVHANFASFQGYAAYAIWQITGIPFGFTVHAHDIFLDHFMIPEKVATASLVVSISEYNAEYMKRHFGVPTDKIRVIHCGVDLEEFAPAPTPGDGVPLLLSVGRLDAMKGFDTLLTACRLLRDRTDYRCAIVGSGEQLTALQRTIAAWRLGDRVRILTSVPQSELIELYRRCRVYVQPCRRDRSGMQDGVPATLMEAMAVGKPVVSTRLSGIPELVEEGVEGLLVRPDDPAALVEAIVALLDDPERARRMGEASRRKICEQFDVAGNARRLGEEIRRILSSAPPPPEVRPT